MRDLRQLRGKALWAALAVLIDGEGCITVLRTKRPGGVDQYTPVISVVNTNIEWLHAWRDRLDRGTIRGFVPSNNRWKARATWQINRKADVVYVLKQIAPYLFCKQQQAALVCSLIQNKISGQNAVGAHGRTAPPETELFRREAIYSEIRALNAKGIRRDYMPSTLVGDDIVRAAEPPAEPHANVAA